MTCIPTRQPYSHRSISIFSTPAAVFCVAVQLLPSPMVSRYVGGHSRARKPSPGAPGFAARDAPLNAIRMRSGTPFYACSIEFEACCFKTLYQARLERAPHQNDTQAETDGLGLIVKPVLCETNPAVNSTTSFEER